MSARKQPTKRGAKKTARKTPRPVITGSAGVAVSPITGATIPLGAFPGNTGGKPGRSGRIPDAIRQRLREGLDAHGVDFVVDTLKGEVNYTLHGKCSHCGKKSTGQSIDELLKMIPSADTRLRAFDAAARHALTEPLELVITSENARGFFDCITRAIEELAPEQAPAIHERAKALFEGATKV